MKKTLLFGLLAASLAAFAAETATTYQLTHLSRSEVGIRCTGGTILGARQVADMIVLTCAPKK